MYRGLICDLDGTVYLSGKPLPGVVDALRALRSDGVRVLFVSNNPLRDSRSYAERLTSMGIPATPDEVLTSGAVTAEWVRQHTPDARLLVLGETNLRDELTAVGVKLVERADQTDVVVASFDRTFTYDKWVEAFRAIRAGARFVATNPDPTCPVDDGEVPDCGGIIAALETTTGRSVEVVLGKPSRAMLDAALRRIELPADEVLIVGDRLGTDIAMGTSHGVASALVLTGVTTRAMASALSDDQRPTYVLESVSELPSAVFGSA